MNVEGLSNPNNQPERRVLLVCLEKFKDSEKLMLGEKRGRIEEKRANLFFPSLVHGIQVKSKHRMSVEEY